VDGWDTQILCNYCGIHTNTMDEWMGIKGRKEIKLQSLRIFHLRFT